MACHGNATGFCNHTEFAKNGKKILGAGVNYNAALTYYNLPKPEKPIIFMKPSTAYIQEGQNIVIPEDFKVNEEVELGVVICSRGKHIAVEEAMDYVAGYCLALDLTATSFLGPAKVAGHPWTLGKGFDTACPVSRFICADELPNPPHVNLWLKVNGEQRQEGNTSDLIYSVAQLVSYVSQFMTLEADDMILTGTPPGQSEILPGDVIEAGLSLLPDNSQHLLTIKFTVQTNDEDESEECAKYCK